MAKEDIVTGPSHKGANTATGEGEGIRSLRTSGVFRAVNFELYAKPVRPTSNKKGAFAFLKCNHMAFLF